MLLPEHGESGLARDVALVQLHLQLGELLLPRVEHDLRRCVTPSLLQLLVDVVQLAPEVLVYLVQGVISAKSVWERFIGVKKVCDKIWPKLHYISYMEEIMAIKCNNLPQKQCFLVKTTLKFQIFPKIIKNFLFSSKKSVRFVTSLGTLFPVPV